jgi:hypothetical protein
MSGLSAKEVKNFVIEALKRKQIPYIYGPPGIGKSDLTKQVAEEFNLQLIDIRLSQLLPEDIAGIPIINSTTRRAEYCTFDVFPLEGDSLPKDSDGNLMQGWLLFLDELSSSSEEVMAAIYKLLLDRKLGNHNIHPKALIIAAGNKASDSAIARELPDTLITRLLPVEMKVKEKDWNNWFKNSLNFNTTVSDFINKFPEALFSVRDNATSTELETRATPRGWEKVAIIMNFIENTYPKKQRLDNAGIPISGEFEPIDPRPVDYHLIQAAIGKIHATAFKEYYISTVKLPSVWEIASAPASTPIPPSNAGKATVIDNLSQYFTNSEDSVRDKILQYVNRMGDEFRSMFSASLSKQLGTTKSDLSLIDEVNKRLHVVLIGFDKQINDEAKTQNDAAFYKMYKNYMNQSHNDKKIKGEFLMDFPKEYLNDCY